jgi:uncharacterized membrane protein
MRGHRDLTAATAGAALCAVVAVSVPPEGVRLAAALPLALLLPGYAVTAAAFAGRVLPRPQLFLLSVALSLATLALGALVLDVVPGGIRRGSWAALLVVVVAGGCMTASRRRPRSANGHLPHLRLHLRASEGALLLGATLALAGAFGLSWTSVPAKNAVGYAQLWMLPQGGTKIPSVQVGVVSKEQHSTAYRLRVRWAGQSKSFTSRLSLKPGEERVFEVPVTRPPPGRSLRVYAFLYRDDRPGEVFRLVNAWIPGTGTPS